MKNFKIIFKIIIVTILIIGVSDGPSFSEINQMPIDQCIDIALENHLPLYIAKNEIRLSNLKVNEAKREFKPEANFSWEETDSKLAGVPNSLGRRFYLELKRPLYRGGRLEGVLKQAEIDAKISEYKIEKIKNELIFEVEKAYYPLAVSKLEIIDYKKLVEDAKILLQMSEEKYKQKLINKMEVLKVRSIYDQIKYKLKSAEDELEVNKIALRHILEIKYDVDINVNSLLEINKLPLTLNDCLSVAFENRPDLKIDMFSIDFNKAGIEVAQANRKPNIELTALVGRGAENFENEKFSFKNEWFLGLQFSKPWGNTTIKSATLAQDRVPQAGQVDSTEFTDHTLSLVPNDKKIFKADSEQQTAKVQYYNAVKQLEKTEQTVESEVKEAYYNYQKAIFKINSSLRKIMLKKEEIDIVNMQNLLNEKEISDILSAKLKLQMERSEYLRALRDLKTAEAKLKWAVGGNL